MIIALLGAVMAKPRPLSPHLQIYRPQLTSTMSISHRATGAALAAGTLLLCLWLVALAAGDVWYSMAAMMIGVSDTNSKLCVMDVFVRLTTHAAKWIARHTPEVVRRRYVFLYP